MDRRAVAVRGGISLHCTIRRVLASVEGDLYGFFLSSYLNSFCGSAFSVN